MQHSPSTNQPYNKKQPILNIPKSIKTKKTISITTYQLHKIKKQINNIPDKDIFSMKKTDKIKLQVVIYQAYS